jgi:hypothetical protein
MIDAVIIVLGIALVVAALGPAFRDQQRRSTPERPHRREQRDARATAKYRKAS